MIDLKKETAELLAFLEKQPRLSGSAEQEGQELRDRQTARIYNGGTVKEPENEKAPVQTSEEIKSLLSRISPDCAYSDWFRVACALKHEKQPYKVFRDWSAQAPKRFDEDVCEKTWESIGEDHAAKVSKGTLRWMAGKSFLSEPQTPDEMAQQAAIFIDSMFLPGESFELVVNSRSNEKGKYIPVRSKENVCRHDKEFET